MPGVSHGEPREVLALRGRLSATVLRGAPALSAEALRAYLRAHLAGADPAQALAGILEGPDPVRGHREGSNVMCTTGYAAIAAALVWSGIQDQAANLGVTSATFLTPLYGAVGSGTGTPSNTDTALYAELGRQAVGAGASSPGSSNIATSATWVFYFPSPPTAWTVTEAGMFAGATSASGSGSLVDHWVFSPALPVPTTDSLLLQVSLLLGP